MLEDTPTPITDYVSTKEASERYDIWVLLVWLPSYPVRWPLFLPETLTR